MYGAVQMAAKKYRIRKSSATNARQQRHFAYKNGQEIRTRANRNMKLAKPIDMARNLHQPQQAFQLNRDAS